MSTTIDGVIYLRDEADYVVLEDIPQSFTIETDITISRYGTLFSITSSDIALPMKIYVLEEAGVPYLEWMNAGYTDRFRFNLPYNHYTLAFSYDNGTARVYINGSLTRTYTFQTIYTLTDLRFGQEGHPVYTAECYIDEFTVYDFAFTGDTVEKDLIADFTANITSGGAPLAVQFTDESTSKTNKIVAWNWDFGDTNTSTDSNPSNTYATEGMFHVSLTVTDSNNQTSTETKPFYINVSGNIAEITAAFESDVVKGEPPLTVHFEDCSQSPHQITSWQWNFDTTNHTHADSTEQNPTYTYEEAGVYNVSLKVIDTNGDYDSKVEAAYIYCEVNENIAPVAEFLIIAPQPRYLAGVRINDSISFIDQSSNMGSGQAPLTWHWDFGDTNTSELQTTRHAYTEVGTFTVSLTVTNAYGTSTETKTDCITVVVADCDPPAVGFMAIDSTVNTGDTVDFRDTSYHNPVSWSWDFGDGATSTLQHPTHAYNSAGYYDVTLYAESLCGGNKLTKSNYVTVNSVATAAFTSDITSTYGTAIEFYDQSEGDITEWFWNFGDSATSQEQNPTHIYPENRTGSPERYTVSLTIYSGTTSDTETKTDYITINPTTYPDNYPDPPAPGQLFLDPRAGVNPLPVNVVLYNLSPYISEGNQYHILWGDESTTLSYIPWEENAKSHSYTKPGKYTAILQCYSKDGTIIFTYENTVNIYYSDALDISVEPIPIGGETCTVSQVYKPITYPAAQYPAENLAAGQCTEIAITYTLPTCPRLSSTINDQYVVLLSTDTTLVTTNEMALNLLYHITGRQLVIEHIECWNSTLQKFTTVIPNKGNLKIVYIINNQSEKFQGKFDIMEVYVDDNLFARYDTVKHIPVNPIHFYGPSPRIGQFNQGINYFHDLPYTPLGTKFLHGSSIDSLTVKFNDTDFYVDFSGTPLTSQSLPLTVQFSDLTPASTSYTHLWNFGDGNTSTEKDPEHTYTSIGTGLFTVTLTETSGARSETLTKTNYVKVNNSTVLAQFALNQGATSIYSDKVSPFSWLLDTPCGFYDQSTTTGSITTRTWDFGDGTKLTTTEDYISHKYSRCGYFTVSLTVTDNLGNTDTETKTSYLDIYDTAPNYKYPARLQKLTYLDKRTYYPTYPNQYTEAKATIAYNQEDYDGAIQLATPTNSLYAAKCTGTVTKDEAWQSIIKFGDKESYAEVLDPNNIESVTTYSEDQFEDFYNAFSMEVDFVFRDFATTDFGGTIFSLFDTSSNNEVNCMINVHLCTDSYYRVSFDQYAPTFPLTLSEFTICPDTEYTLLLIHQNRDYKLVERQDNTDCFANDSYDIVENYNITPEIRAYIKTNGHYYLLGKYTLAASTIGNAKLYLAGPHGTLRSSTQFEYREVRTYNYPRDKTYDSSWWFHQKPIAKFLPITEYKKSDPTLYAEYIAEDFGACGSVTTTKYTGYGVYSSTDSYLINLPLSGAVSNEEFGLLLDNDALTFATESVTYSDLIYNHTFTFTGVGQSSTNYYLIMIVDEIMSGEETLKNSMNLDILDTLTISHVTYRYGDTMVPLKLLVTRYPVNALSGTYEFDYSLVMGVD
jgi:PKD repeat protein